MAYAQYVSTVAKYKLVKNEDLMADDHVAVHLTKIGFYLKRTSLISSALRPIFSEMISKLPLIAQGPQPSFLINYNKVQSLWTLFADSIEHHDAKFPSDQCMPILQHSFTVIQNLQKVLPQLVTAVASKHTNLIEPLTNQLNEVIADLDTISSNVTSCENQYQSKAPQISSADLPMATHVTACLTALDQLLIELSLLSADINPTQAQQDVQTQKKSLLAWIQQVTAVISKLFATPRNDSKVLAQGISYASSQLPFVASVLGAIQNLFIENADFSSATQALITAIQTLNEAECKTLEKDISEIIKTFASLFLNNKPLTDVISRARYLISLFDEKMKVGAQIGMREDILAMYTSLTSLFSLPQKQLDANPELVCLGLVSTIRFVSRLYPDAASSEEFLHSLSKKIGTITRSLYKEATKQLSQISSLLETNLEFFPEQTLAQANYYLDLSKNIDFDIESREFLKNQELFFNVIGSISAPLSKMTSSCQDTQTKNNLMSALEAIQSIACRYGRWLNQFYLCQSEILSMRAESSISITTFPATVLQALGKGDSLKVVNHVAAGIQSILQHIPQLHIFSLHDTCDLFTLFTKATDVSNEFLKVINQYTQSASYPIYRLGATALTKIVSKLPDSVSTLPILVQLKDNETFMSEFVSNLSTSQLICIENKNAFAKREPFLPLHLSAPLSFFLSSECLIRASGRNGQSLVQYSTNARQNVDIIWPISLQVSLGKEPKEASALPDFVERFIKSMNELLLQALDLPQPELPYDIPEDIQEIKKYDATAAAIHSEPIREFAQYMIRTLKKSTAADVRAALQQWFVAIHSQPSETSTATENLSNAIAQLLGAATADRSQFIESFAELSYSLAYYTNGYGKTVGPVVATLHKQLVGLTLEFLETGRSSPQLLTKIFACVQEIDALAPISKLKQKEMEKYLTEILKKAVISLNSLRTKQQPQLRDTLDVISALKQLGAFFQISPPTDNLNLPQILDSFITGKSRDFLDSAVKTFSQRLLELIPNQFNELDRIRDTDTVCDFVYDRAEEFRDHVNNVVSVAKNGETTKEQLIPSLNSMILGISDAAILTMRSLDLSGLLFTPLANLFAECFGELCSGISQFITIAFKIPGTKQDLGPELRRINRKMSKQFDTFINIVENPQRPFGETIEFESFKNQMYASLLTLVIPIARLLGLAATALVPEMYTDQRSPITATAVDAQMQVKEAVDKVSSHAVGASSSEFSSFVPQLYEHLKELLDSSQLVKFGYGVFSPNPLIGPLKSFAESLLKITHLGPTLTDKIVIDPDPASAGKVPDDFEVPPLPKSAPAPTDALQEMALAKRQLDEVVTVFRSTCEQALATSQDLLKAITTLREAVNGFAEKALVMAVATVDTRYQVEEQTALHAFANSVNAVQEAMRARLLRRQGFAVEMDDALNTFTATGKKCIELAEVAATIEVQQDDDESMDEVSKELMATSKAIEKMSARLKEFQTQMHVEELAEDEEDNHPVIDAEEGSLPAFLVQSANPILQATSAILRRAQEITADLIRKFGKIDNERGLIKSAQDLSEAAELLLICAEIIVKGEEKDSEFKVISAARIIKASVSALVAQVLVKGGDNEGIMNKHVRVVVRHTDAVIVRAEAIVDKKLTEEEAKKPKKMVNNPMILRLNMQQTVNQQRKQLQDEEKALYQFRRKG